MNNSRRTVFDTFKSEGYLSLQTLSSFLSFSFCFLSFHKNPLGLKLWNLGRTIEYFATFLLISTFLPTMSPAATEVVLSWLALAFRLMSFPRFIPLLPNVLGKDVGHHLLAQDPPLTFHLLQASLHSKFVNNSFSCVIIYPNLSVTNSMLITFTCKRRYSTLLKRQVWATVGLENILRNLMSV